MKRKIIFVTLFTLLTLLLFCTCDDSASVADPEDGGAGSGGEGQRFPDIASIREDMFHLPLDAAPVEDLSPPPEPAYIEMALNPKKSLYTRSDHPQATAQIFDPYGEILERELIWSVPAGAATLDEQQQLSFTGEGAGAIKACWQQLCGRVSFFVDDAPPHLELSSPERGAIFLGGVAQIPVRGRSDPGAMVFLNDRAVELAPDGSFEVQLPAHFGLNRIQVIADDGVRRPPERIVMEVIWAPQALPVRPDGVDLAQGMQLRLGQQLLKASNPAPPINSIEGLVSAFLGKIQPMGLLEDPLLVNNDNLKIEIQDVQLGVPDLALSWTDSGLELFLRMDELRLSLAQGSLVNLQSELIPLDGSVRMGVAAFVGIGVEAGEGEPRFRFEELGVAMESLRGEGLHPTAQALLDTVGSAVRLALNEAADGLIEGLIREQIPAFIELGLSEALAPLSQLILDVPLPGEGLPSLYMELGFALDEPQVRAREGLLLSLSSFINLRGVIEAPRADPGVPAEGLNSAPPWPAQGGLAIAVQLSVVNALLHEVWRQGLLQLDISSLLPAQIAFLLHSAHIDARLPPLVVGTAPGSPLLFELQLGELLFELEGPGSLEPSRYALSIRAGLILEVGERGLRFQIADEADIRIEQLSEAAPLLEPEALEELLNALVWSKVREAVGAGLSLEIPQASFDTGSFGGLFPELHQVNLGARFPHPPRVQRGWFVLSADLEASLD